MNVLCPSPPRSWHTSLIVTYAHMHAHSVQCYNWKWKYLSGISRPTWFQRPVCDHRCLPRVCCGNHNHGSINSLFYSIIFFMYALYIACGSWKWYP